jgi:hypothetical protein
MESIVFSSFLSTDFSSYYVDSYNNTPNSLILNNGLNSLYNGVYNNIYLYDFLGLYIFNTYYTYLRLNINNTIYSLNKNGINQYFNNQHWIFSQFIDISGNIYTNVEFNPVFLTNNSSQYNLINQYKGFTFPKKTQKWYLNYSSIKLVTLQMIWGQGDIPQEYYSICGFAGTTNVQAQNPFTNTNGPYYSTYITSNDNYASNSGWIIVLAGPYDPTLVNPPYLEDI